MNVLTVKNMLKNQILKPAILLVASYNLVTITFQVASNKKQVTINKYRETINKFIQISLKVTGNW